MQVPKSNVVPFSAPGPAAPPIPPVYLHMAAAQMAAESALQPKAVGSESRDPMGINAFSLGLEPNAEDSRAMKREIDKTRSDDGHR